MYLVDGMNPAEASSFRQALERPASTIEVAELPERIVIEADLMGRLRVLKAKDCNLSPDRIWELDRLAADYTSAVRLANGPNLERAEHWRRKAAIWRTRFAAAIVRAEQLVAKNN